VRTIILALAAALLVGCGGSFAGPDSAGECSNKAQKETVFAAMQYWYLWNDLLPTDVKISDFTTPEDLLAYLTTFSPVDGSGHPVDVFSFINSAAADAQFFAEGKFQGFGFSRKDLGGNDIRLTRVFSASPAEIGGLARGQQILQLNGRTIAQIEAAEGLDTVLSSTPLTFTMREPNGNEFTTTIAHDEVTIDPLPQWRIIDAGGGRMVGYLELATFISTADPVFSTIFAQFAANGVNDVIIDLRYNSGGLVSTAELLGDFLGGNVAQNLMFSKTLFNADRAAVHNDEEFFELLAHSMSLSRLVVITSRATASASELVTNSMAAHVEVAIVGDRTFGKPVGQVGLAYCDKIFRPTAFSTVNADDFGDYFDGLPTNPGCDAPDDLAIPVGADTDPNLIVAMNYLDTGNCVAAAAASAYKLENAAQIPPAIRRGPPWRTFAGAH